MKATTEMREYLQESAKRYFKVAEERPDKLPPHGAWEVGLLIDGDVPPHSVSQEFLNLLSSSNPRYTGWPVWLDSRGFLEKSARPCVFEGAWEALLVFLDSDGRNDIDFMRLSPEGRFYLRRALQDDIQSSRKPEPMTSLDFTRPICGTAEAIAVGIAFAKAMGCDPEKTQLAFGFRWTTLKKRHLVFRADPRHSLPLLPKGPAYQNEFITCVEVSLQTPLSALGEIVNQVVQPLFEIFDGFVLSKNVVEELTRGVLETRS